MRGSLVSLTAFSAWLVAAPGWAADDAGTRPLSARELEEWLDEPAGETPTDLGPAEAPEAPPPPPRHQGLTVESGLGAFGHLGPLQDISPVSPWFQTKVGFEPLRWAMVFIEGDLIFSSTSLAPPPPGRRTYRLYGGGAGVRLSVELLDRLGVFLEGSVGLAKVSEDILSIYGFQDADELNPYYGGLFGIEWYPVNPHLAVALRGGARIYAAGLSRDRGGGTAIAWLGGPTIRYTF